MLTPATFQRPNSKFQIPNKGVIKKSIRLSLNMSTQVYFSNYRTVEQQEVAHLLLSYSSISGASFTTIRNWKGLPKRKQGI
jgi:hypothetical protein